MPKATYSDLKFSCQIKPPEQLMDIFENNGCNLPSGCLAGSCGVCVVEILQGGDQFESPSKVELNTLQRLYPDALRTLGINLRLGCRLKVIKDLKIDIIFKKFLSAS